MISKKKRKLREKMRMSKMKRSDYAWASDVDIFDWAEYLRCAGNRDNDFMVIPEGSKII